MNASMLLWDRLKKGRMIVWLAPEKAHDCITAYETLHPLGIVLEIGLTSPAAVEGIKALKEKHPYALVLAGNVMSHHQADLVIDAGASGVVSSDYIPIVTEACVRRDVLCLPAGLADVGKQLVQKATHYNCELDELRVHRPYQWTYMLFPAMAGPAHHLEMAAIWKSIYHDLLVVYSGGVTREKLHEIVASNDTGIVRTKRIASCIDDPEKMREEAEAWLAVIHQTGESECEAVETNEKNEAIEEKQEATDVEVEPEHVESREGAEPLADEPAYSVDDDSARIYVNL